MGVREYGGIAKLSDAETEAGEMQCWFDFALQLKYMGVVEYKNFDNKYEHIISQLVTMIQDAEKWCTL